MDLTTIRFPVGELSLRRLEPRNHHGGRRGDDQLEPVPKVAVFGVGSKVTKPLGLRGRISGKLITICALWTSPAPRAATLLLRVHFAKCATGGLRRLQ